MYSSITTFFAHTYIQICNFKGYFAAQQQFKGLKLVSLDEALGTLMSGFLRGGVGFLKGTGEIIKGSSGVNREVRVGVTHVSIVKSL